MENIDFFFFNRRKFPGRLFFSISSKIFSKPDFDENSQKATRDFFTGIQIQQASTNWSEKLLGRKIFLNSRLCDVILLLLRFWKLKKGGNFQEKFREPRVRLSFTAHHSPHWSHIYRTSYMWNSKTNFFFLVWGVFNERKYQPLLTLISRQQVMG